MHRVRYCHYNDVIMGMIASQITSLAIVYSIVYADADQRKHESSASLAFVRGIHRGQVNSPHKWPVTWKIYPFDDVIMVQNEKNNCVTVRKVINKMLPQNLGAKWDSVWFPALQWCIVFIIGPFVVRLIRNWNSVKFFDKNGHYLGGFHTNSIACNWPKFVKTFETQAILCHWG